MVTGDNIQTAKAIALECGILSPDADTSEPYVIEGKRFRELSEKDREQIAKKISVCFFKKTFLYLYSSMPYHNDLVNIMLIMNRSWEDLLQLTNFCLFKLYVN